MIKLRRDLYMNEAHGALLSTAEKLTADVAAAINAGRIAFAAESGFA